MHSESLDSIFMAGHVLQGHEGASGPSDSTPARVAAITRTHVDEEPSFLQVYPGLDNVDAIEVSPNGSLLAAIGRQDTERLLYTISTLDGSTVGGVRSIDAELALPVFNGENTPMVIYTSRDGNLSLGLDNSSVVDFGASSADLSSGLAVVRDSHGEVRKLFTGSDMPNSHFGLVQLERVGHEWEMTEMPIAINAMSASAEVFFQRTSNIRLAEDGSRKWLVGSSEYTFATSNQRQIAVWRVQLDSSDSPMRETAEVLKFIPFDKKTEIQSLDSHLANDKIKLVLHHSTDGKVSLAIADFQTGHVTAVEADAGNSGFESDYHTLFIESQISVISAKKWSKSQSVDPILTFECLENISSHRSQTIRGRVIKQTEQVFKSSSEQTRRARANQQSTSDEDQVAAALQALWTDQLKRQDADDEDDEEVESEDGTVRQRRKLKSKDGAEDSGTDNDGIDTSAEEDDVSSNQVSQTDNDGIDTSADEAADQTSQDSQTDNDGIDTSAEEGDGLNNGAS